MTIRRAEPRDARRLGELGAALMQTHYAFDTRRFLEPVEGAEAGYARFLVSQLRDKESIVMVAERDDDIVGYVYAAIEPLSWKELRDECGVIHDLLGAVVARNTSIGDALS